MDYKEVYCFDVYLQNGVAMFGSDRQIDGVAGLCARVRWQTGSSFVVQRLLQTVYACGFVRFFE